MTRALDWVSFQVVIRTRASAVSMPSDSCRAELGSVVPLSWLGCWEQGYQGPGLLVALPAGQSVVDRAEPS